MHPGVIFDNLTTPMENLVFDNVKFNNPKKGEERNIMCKNVECIYFM